MALPKLPLQVISTGACALLLSACDFGTDCTMMGNGPSLGLTLTQEYQDDESPRRERSFDVTLTDEQGSIGRYHCNWSPKIEEHQPQSCTGEDDAPDYFTRSVTTSTSASGVQIQILLSKSPQDPKLNQTGPKRLDVRIEDENAVHFEASYTPVYKTQEINGPGCGTSESASLAPETFRFQDKVPDPALSE